MATMRNSLLSRVAVQSMQWAVRVWPESSRQWGMAVLGEMGEIAEPGAALSWAAGGMLLFLRAMLAQFLQWMKLPVGLGFSGGALPSGNNGPQFPKHSRLATAVVLLAAVTLLFLPTGREAARTVEASWRGFIPSQRDRQDLENLAAKAEKEKDAGTVGFVALTHPDADRATHFADEAVKLDPSLMWIYASRYSYCCNVNMAPTAARVKKLKSYDPDNAMVYLVNASVEGEPLVEKASKATGSAWKPLSEALAKNDEWMKDMEAAFHAPKYDNYFHRHQELVRETWKKAPGLSPGAVVIGLWSHSIPNGLQMQTYAELRVNQALKAGAAGNVKDAESILAEVTDLGKRMMASEAITFEQMVGLGLTKRGLEGYEKLYRANAQTKKADEIEAELREVETTTGARIHAYIDWREGIARGLRWRAVLLQAAAVLALLLAIGIGLSLLLLESSAAIGRKSRGWSRRAACKLVDYGPAAFLVTSLTFLWSFRPIAAFFEQYRLGELKSPEVLGMFWQLFVLGAASPALYFFDPYHQWLLATIGLAAIAVFVVVRGLLRLKGAAGRL